MSALRRASVASQVALLALAPRREGPGALSRLLRADDGSEAAPSALLALQVVAVAALLALSGLFAGLGLGLMSLDLIGLEIVVAAGQDELASAQERRNSAAARRIIPIRRQGNLLLTTLLMGNVSVNALTSILMADLTSGTVGFLVSTVLIVLFGEIIPQALCTKHAIVIGSKAVPCVRVLLALFYVFAKPVSMVLDRYLGEDIGTIFTKSQLAEMIGIHQKQQMIDEEESEILRGAMTFRGKTAKSIMTPAAELFTVPSSGLLDQKMIHEIIESGFSRVLVTDPVTKGVVAMIHVKDLIFVDPKDNVPLSSFVHVFGRSMNTVRPECKLDSLLQMFRTESTHLALVRDFAPPVEVPVEEISEAEPTDASDAARVEPRLLGIVTFEDVLEEILQDEILDERDAGAPADQALAPRRRRAFRLYADSGRLGLAAMRLPEGDSTDMEALARHLQETNAAFRAPTSCGAPPSAAQLAAFLGSCPTLQLEPARAPERLLERDCPSAHCLVVLDGRLLVTDADGNARTAGPWTALAADALVTQEGLYLADVSARSSHEAPVRCLRISRADFQRRLLRPLPRRDSRGG